MYRKIWADSRWNSETEKNGEWKENVSIKIEKNYMFVFFPKKKKFHNSNCPILTRICMFIYNLLMSD